MLKLATPPRIKVLEALGAVAGGRVRIISDKEAEVDASEGSRTYKVYVDLENHVANCDDNGTVYRNYVGYPIIAFLMAKNLLPYDESLAKPLAGVKWRSLNERYKSYRKVEAIIKEMVSKHGVQSMRVDQVIEEVLRRLEGFGLQKPSI
ncbi:MAG: hypothetical protein QXR26_04750 [Candidatus Caldarchaeum sp.]